MASRADSKIPRNRSSDSRNFAWRAIRAEMSVKNPM
jgi:hypothetical protein